MEKMSLSREDVVAMFNALDEVGVMKGDPQVTYALGRTKRSIRDTAETISESGTPDEGFDQFNKLRDEHCRKYALKDDKGNPIAADNNWTIDPDLRAEFEAGAQKLREMYADSIDKEEARRKTFKAWRREPVEVEVHKIKLSLLQTVYNPKTPELSLSVGQMVSLDPIIINDLATEPKATEEKVD